MATTINADTSNGLKLTSDTSGVIEFQSAGTTKAGVNSTGLTGNGSQLTALTSGNLTGALPAISGAALTGISSGGVSHLGTLTTTSGTSQALAAQNFSLYNQIWIVTDNVSSGGSADFQVGFNGDAVINTSGAVPAASGTWAWFRFDLRTNVFNQTWLQSTATTSGSGTFDNIPTTGGYYNLGTNYRSVTSGAITIAMEGQTFDAGSAEIYGVK